MKYAKFTTVIGATAFAAAMLAQNAHAQSTTNGIKDAQVQTAQARVDAQNNSAETAQAAGQHDHGQAAPPAVKSEAQLTFDAVKSLAGDWQGPVNTDMGMAKEMEGGLMTVTMRVTSRGNVLVHEFQQANTALDPLKYDHPVTMVYLDTDQLNLVHYCDAGNRPHMVARRSADGKTIDFDLVEVGGSTKRGHMQHIQFTMIDANHHLEVFTFKLPNDKIVHAKMDLRRKMDNAPVSGN